MFRWISKRTLDNEMFQLGLLISEQNEQVEKMQSKINELVTALNDTNDAVNKLIASDMIRTLADPVPASLSWAAKIVRQQANESMRDRKSDSAVLEDIQNNGPISSCGCRSCRSARAGSSVYQEHRPTETEKADYANVLDNLMSKVGDPERQDLRDQEITANDWLKDSPEDLGPGQDPQKTDS